MYVCDVVTAHCTLTWHIAPEFGHGLLGRIDLGAFGVLGDALEALHLETTEGQKEKGRKEGVKEGVKK